MSFILWIIVTISLSNFTSQIQARIVSFFPANATANTNTSCSSFTTTPGLVSLSTITTTPGFFYTPRPPLQRNASISVATNSASTVSYAESATPLANMHTRHRSLTVNFAPDPAPTAPNLGNLKINLQASPLDSSDQIVAPLTATSFSRMHLLRKPSSNASAATTVALFPKMTPATTPRTVRV